jgi:hypothetical protein
MSYGALRAEGYWNKQISPDNMAIMISHRGVCVSSKAPHDKAGATRLQGMRQVAH